MVWQVSAFAGASAQGPGVERAGAQDETAPAYAAGHDGEEDSPETLIQEMAVALSKGGGFWISF